MKNNYGPNLNCPTKETEWTSLTLKLEENKVLRTTGKQEQVIGTYVCSQKHNYIPYITFTITTVQLHVPAINVGHLQVVHEAPYNKLYRKVLHAQPEDGQH